MADSLGLTRLGSLETNGRISLATSMAAARTVLALALLYRVHALCSLQSATPPLGPAAGGGSVRLEVQGDWSQQHLLAVDDSVFAVEELMPEDSDDPYAIRMPAHLPGDALISSPNCSGLLVYEYYGACDRCGYGGYVCAVVVAFGIGDGLLRFLTRAAVRFCCCACVRMFACLRACAWCSTMVTCDHRPVGGDARRIHRPHPRRRRLEHCDHVRGLGDPPLGARPPSAAQHARHSLRGVQRRGAARRAAGGPDSGLPHQQPGSHPVVLSGQCDGGGGSERRGVRADVSGVRDDGRPCISGVVCVQLRHRRFWLDVRPQRGSHGSRRIVRVGHRNLVR
jgi:hypothetical protein